MATINYTAEHNVAASCVKVEWAGLAPGDVGQSFDGSGLKISSIHYWGSFSGGQLQLQVSNELSPANFIGVDSTNSPTVRMPKDANDIPDAAASVRPFLDGGSGSGAVSILFEKV